MKRILSIILAVLMLLPFAAFAEGTGTLALASSAEGRDDGVESHITVANPTKVQGAFFTRQFGNNTSDIDVRAMLHGYNPIVWTTQLTYITDPMVVKDLSVKDHHGNSMYIFNIARDLKWNDGTPITAADYVFTIALLASKEFMAIGGDTDVWKHIVGYEEYVSGETAALEGVRYLDDYKFAIEVKKEYLPYFYEYSLLYLMPCPMSVIAPGCRVKDDSDGVYICNDVDQKANKPIFTSALLKKTILDSKNGYLSHPGVTCGPYSLVSYDASSGTVEFTMNPYYKGNYEGAKPTIRNVTLKHVLPQNLAAALKDGTIDVINKAVEADVITDCMKAAQERGCDNQRYDRLGYGFIGLACEQGPQQFEKVRQAIAYAFDTDDFVNEWLKGYGNPVYAYYGIGQWMYKACAGTLNPAIVLPESAYSLTEEQKQNKDYSSVWAGYSLKNLNKYELDADKALDLLILDGWTLNSKGNDFDPEKDTLRYKKISEVDVANKATRNGLMPLMFEFALAKDNEMAADVLARLQEVLVPLGVKINVHEIPFAEVLNDYLREKGMRKYDMSFLAYNFNSIFDPLVEMASEDEYPGSQNASGLVDSEIVDLCWDLHLTAPGDNMTFLKRWIAFEERYNEILPSIPLYSNVYYDFFIKELQNYNPGGDANWPRAMLYAVLAD